MYIRKSVLNAAVATAGFLILAVLAGMYCFTELNIPVPVYAAAWILCLFGMSSAVTRISSRQ